MDLLALAPSVALLAVLGTGAGFATGLIPGIHPNTVAAGLLIAKAAFLGFTSAALGVHATADGIALLCAFLVAAVVAHGVGSFLPSVFLGAPGETNAVSVLPGHRMLRVGRGPEAVATAAQGAVLGAFATVALLLPLRWAMGPPLNGHDLARGFIPLILGVLIVALILSEGPRRTRARTGSARAQRGRATLLFLGSGVFGWVTLGTDVPRLWNWFPIPGLGADASSQLLMPMFTGLFGLSTLLVSLHGPASVPPQSPAGHARLRVRRAVICGSLAGAAVSWLPGLSSGAATSVAQFLARRRRGDEDDPVEFMAALGAAGTATSVLTVAALFIIEKTRSGVAVAVRDLVGSSVPWIDPGTLPNLVAVILGAAVLAAVLSYPLAIRAARLYASVVVRLPYRGIAVAVAAFLAGLIFVSSGVTGLIVAGCAVPLGVLPPRWGVKRVHLMGSLLVPVLVFSA